MGEYNILFADKICGEYAYHLSLLEYVAGSGMVSAAKRVETAERLLLEAKGEGKIYNVVSSGLVFEKRGDGLEILKLAAELNHKSVLILHTGAELAEVEEKLRASKIRSLVLLRKPEVHAQTFAQAVRDLLGNGKVFGNAPTGLEARRDILELKKRLVDLTPKYAHGKVMGDAGKVKL